MSGVSDTVEKGEPIFRLDSSRQEAAARDGAPQDHRGRGGDGGGASRHRGGGGPDPAGPERLAAGRRRAARPSRSCNRRNADIVARREIEKLQNVVEGRQGAVDAAAAAKQAAEAKLSRLLPAEKASAEAALAAGPGRSRQDRRPRRRQRPGGAVRRCGSATSSTRSCVRPAS